VGAHARCILTLSRPPDPDEPGGYVPASSILLIENDLASGDVISSTLIKLGYAVTSFIDPDEAFGHVAEHQMVILDVIGGPRTALDVCRELRAIPIMASIAVLCISQTDQVEERIHFLEVGADDVMARPFDARELEARVEALLLRYQRSKDLSPAVGVDGSILPKRRRTVAVFSPKGGVGTTTIAANVAMAQAQGKPDKVVLIDLDLQFGQAAAHVNLEVKHTVAELVRDESAILEPALLRTYAMRHDSGLHVIASPRTPAEAELIETGHVEQLLQTALEWYEEVVIDAGSVLDQRILAVFEHADAVILPVYPEIAALRSMRALIDYLNETGSIATKSTFVLNNMFARGILKLRDAESALGTKIAVELPYDPILYLKAVNEGIPLVKGSPRSAPAQQLFLLASTAFAEAGAAPSGPEHERRARGLGALLRR
jgi:pilus assembly protein CpaE